jgi:hypothetical protein
MLFAFSAIAYFPLKHMNERDSLLCSHDNPVTSFNTDEIKILMYQKQNAQCCGYEIINNKAVQQCQN